MSRYECFVGPRVEGCAENEQWMNKGKRRESSSLLPMSAPAMLPLMAKGAQGVASTPEGPKTNAARRGGGPARKFFEF